MYLLSLWWLLVQVRPVWKTFLLIRSSRIRHYDEICHLSWCVIEVEPFFRSGIPDWGCLQPPHVGKWCGGCMEGRWKSNDLFWIAFGCRVNNDRTNRMGMWQGTWLPKTGWKPLNQMVQFLVHVAVWSRVYYCYLHLIQLSVKANYVGPFKGI